MLDLGSTISTQLDLTGSLSQKFFLSSQIHSPDGLRMTGRLGTHLRLISKIDLEERDA